MISSSNVSTLTSSLADMFAVDDYHRAFSGDKDTDNVTVSFLGDEMGGDDGHSHAPGEGRGVTGGGGTGAGGGSGSRQWLKGEVTIPLYSVIFVLATVGNLLVILTLAQNRRMRTITNVYLLNLSVSDLLLAVFCMPFTLIPTILKTFIFGKAMCILVRYMQG